MKRGPSKKGPGSSRSKRDRSNETRERAASATGFSEKTLAVIDGKRYDTTKATAIFENSNGHFVTDFKYRSKTLYRTAKGAWFIHHVGGALTDMAVRVGNNGSGGSEDIEAIDGEDAYGFLEAHSDDEEAVEAIDRFFSDQVEDA